MSWRVKDFIYTNKKINVNGIDVQFINSVAIVSDEAVNYFKNNSNYFVSEEPVREMVVVEDCNSDPNSLKTKKVNNMVLVYF